MRSFLQALSSRYGAEDDISSYDPSAFLVGDPFKTGGRNKTWELVGMEKTRTQQSRYDRLFEVMLREQDMTVALTEEEEVKKFATVHHPPKNSKKAPQLEPNQDEKREGDAAPRLLNALEAENMARLEELDLSANPKLPLKEVGKLVPYFANLRVLQLSDIQGLLPPVHDALLSYASPAEYPAPSLSGETPLLHSARLEKLVLNNVGIKSYASLLLWVNTPKLVELHLDHNQLRDLPLFDVSDMGESASAGVEEITRKKKQMLGALECILRKRRDENARAGAGGVDPLEEAPIFAFPSVRTLSLAHNAFSSWGGAEEEGTDSNSNTEDDDPVEFFLCERRHSLGAVLQHAFPALNALFLTANQLPDIPLPPKTSAKEEVKRRGYYEQFAFLKPLQLLCLRENNTILSTDTLESLRQLAPELQTFRISYASLLSEWNETLARMFVVASLPTITTLNRGHVRPKERLDSEIFYIQRGRRQREEVQEGKTPQPPAYPLLTDLEEKHKELVLSIYREGASASADGGVGGGHLLLQVSLYPENLYVKNTANSSGGSSGKGAQHAVQKTLPSNLTIGKLKALVRVLFAVEPQNQQLRYQPGGDGSVMDMPIPLDNEMETLGYYGVTNGGRIGITDTSLR